MSDLPPWLVPPVVVGVLLAGAALVAVVDAATAAVVAGRSPLAAAARPVHHVAWRLGQQVTTTERPDAVLGWTATLGYLTLPALGLAVIPLGPGLALADTDVGIVVWGSVEALAVAALYLRGWSPNSLQPLLAAYRAVAVGLSFLLLSMFVLIAAALPAESLSVGAVVDAQAGLWNVVRQPLGLPLFLVVALGTAFWGPMALAAGTDLGGGTGAEASGVEALLWDAGRAMMLAASSVLAAAVFLGGWHGPWLPGPVWLAAKAVAVGLALVASRHLVARLPAERFVTVCWTVLLPLAFVDLVVAGVGALP